MPNSMVGLLYTSADMDAKLSANVENDLYITLDLEDRFRHRGGQFGVDFDAQSIDRVAV